MKELGHRAFQDYLRSFPISKGKDRVLARLWKPLSFGQYQRLTTLRYQGVRMNCDLTQYLQRHLYFYGTYEDEVCKYWMEKATQPSIIFDVGANVGLYSLLAAIRNPRSCVHSFEPTPGILRVLRENIRLNGIENIKVNPVSVGREMGTGYLHMCVGMTGDNEGMNFVTGTASESTDITVPVVSLDSYCLEQRIERIDLLKMDIEGGEFDALVGAQGLIQTHKIGTIFIELADWAANRFGHSTRDIKEFLRDSGYQIFRLGAGRLTPVSIPEKHSGDNVIAVAPGIGEN